MKRQINACRATAVRAAAFLIIIVLCVGLKYHYSQTSSVDLTRDLIWMLKPTALLTGALTGTTFIPETGAGWVSRQERLIITASCAGINFLVVALLTVVILTLPSLGAGWIDLWRMVAGIGYAYAAAVMANTLRIAADIYIRRVDFPFWQIDPQSLHRLEGVFVYLVVLVIAARGWELTLNIGNPQRYSGVWMDTAPLTVYAMVVLGIPLVTGGIRGMPPGFREHFFMVTAAATVVGGLFFLVSKRGRKSMKRRQK